ncbi:MAG: VPLPA-CTERM sorting domain-containing protein, partial [Bdellovibrionales bacterium]
ERVAYPGYENNYTIYTNTATDAVELKLWYTYTSYDTIGTAYAGVLYEAAGYILNGVKTQLTPDASVNLLPGVAYHGVLTLSLMAGDVYGFYVFSSDSLCGLSTISVSNVPLPAALPLFAASLFGFGAISRKKRA